MARTYLIHVPDGLPPKNGFPVVLAFHGGGGRASKMIGLMRLEPFADARGFIVIYPNGLDRHWNDGRSTIRNKADDVGFVAALLDEIEKRYPIDASRIFAVGVSNGAVFAERLGCELSNRIHAIAAVSGTMAADLAVACHPSSSVSVLQIAGTADPIMPYGGGTVKQFLGAGEGGTVLSAPATAELWSRLDGCAAPSPSQELPQRGRPDGTAIMRLAFGHCRRGAAVTLLTVKNGGHAWPGGAQTLPMIFGKTSTQLDTSQTIIDFFFSRADR